MKCALFDASPYHCELKLLCFLQKLIHFKLRLLAWVCGTIEGKSRLICDLIKKMIFSARIALHPERNDIKKNIDCMKKEIQSIIKFQDAAMLNALKFVLRLQSRSLVMNCNGWLCLPCNVISRILRLFQIRWLWRVSKSGVPILEMCVGRWDRKSTAHVANSKICRISSKPTVNSIQPLFPVLAPSHHPALSSPHVHLFT